MSEKKFSSIVMLVFSAIVMALLVQDVSGQATAPSQANPTPSGSTPAPTPIPKPRPPTRRDVEQLTALMAWPGSTLTFVAIVFVAIVGNFAEAGFTKGEVGGCMLATNTSGSWEKIADGMGGYAVGDIVQAVPGIPLPVAQALFEQAARNEVYWTKPARQVEWSDKPGTFNYYQMQGNVAGLKGDFDSAIAAWTKAEAPDTSDVKRCRGEADRVQIRAANDAKARMDTLHLTKQEAAEWFEQHDSELWMRNRCDMP
jgi:hypothetical protein